MESQCYLYAHRFYYFISVRVFLQDLYDIRGSIFTLTVLSYNTLMFNRPVTELPGFDGTRKL